MMMKSCKSLLICLGWLIIVSAIFLWPVIYAYGHLAYLMITPSNKVELTQGRNTVFLSLMRGRYCLKIGSDESDDGGWSFDGYVKTGEAITPVNGNMDMKRPYHQYFTCKNPIEHVSILLDVSMPTNSTGGVPAVIFPCK